MALIWLSSVSVILSLTVRFFTVPDGLPLPSVSASTTPSTFQPSNTIHWFRSRKIISHRSDRAYKVSVPWCSKRRYLKPASFPRTVKVLISGTIEKSHSSVSVCCISTIARSPSVSILLRQNRPHHSLLHVHYWGQRYSPCYLYFLIFFVLLLYIAFKMELKEIKVVLIVPSLRKVGK